MVNQRVPNRGGDPQPDRRDDEDSERLLGRLGDSQNATHQRDQPAKRRESQI